MHPQPAAAEMGSGAGLRISSLEGTEDVHRAADLIDQVWQADGLMRANLIRAIAHTGGYAAGAWQDGDLVGVSVAFRGVADDAGQRVHTLHSHATGVLRPASGVGWALKQHQRAWAHDHGIPLITWTFDPLVSRNAYFNLAKLGAVGVRYLVNHYGRMDDGINAGDETDRLEIWWRTGPEQPDDPVAEQTPEVLLLAPGDDDAPVPHGEAGDHPGALLAVTLPRDIESLRSSAPVIARRWRLAVRQTLGAAMATGYTATGMRRDGTCLLTPPAPTRAQAPLS